MKPADLEKHDIRRETLRPEIGLLLGNGEMGGLLTNDGLGFEEIWLTDFWRNEAERAPLGPIRFHQLGETAEVRRYKQVLELAHGIAGTSLDRTGGGSYRSEFFFSQAHRHLMYARIENTSTAAQVWELQMPGAIAAQGPHGAATLCTAKAPPMTLPFTVASVVVRTSLRHEKTTDSRMTFTIPAGEKIECVFVVITSFDAQDYETLAHAAAVEALPFTEERAAHLEQWATLWSGIDIRLPEGLYATAFYRSIYYTLSITGASQFLPGVCQFADSGWEMIPFSNDAGYIPPLLACLNLPGRATAMMREFFKPEALKHNARTYLNLLGAAGTLDEGGESFSFAQMIGISGKETNFIFGRQRHLDGFVPAIFFRTASLISNDPEAAEISYQALKGTAEFWLKMLFLDESKDVLLIRDTLDLDEKTMGVSVLSAVIACHWTLQVFAEQARLQQTDMALADRCESSLRKLYWPQNEDRLLSFPGDTEESVTNKYNCLRSFSTLGYPYGELMAGYDHEKVRRTMDSVRSRNQLEKVDHGVNAMTTNMYALTEAWLGRGEEAHAYASLSLKRLDPSGAAMGEARTDSLFYCSTSYCTFALSTIHMLLQSSEGVIRPFPAVPAAWDTVSFDGLPAEQGIFVSGSMKEGRVEKIIYKQHGKVLLETGDAAPVRIETTGGQTVLTPLP